MMVQILLCFLVKDERVKQLYHFTNFVYSGKKKINLVKYKAWFPENEN